MDQCVKGHVSRPRALGSHLRVHRTYPSHVLEGDGRTTVACWIAVAGVTLGVLALGGWIVTHADVARASPLALAAAVPVGLFVADVASGIVHWSMDTWIDEASPFQRAVLIAREHHSHPSHILQYRDRDHIGFGALPAVAAVGPVTAVPARRTPA